MKKLALTGLVSLFCLCASGPAMAFTSNFGTITVVEDPNAGYIGTVPTSQTPVIVGADGEANFTPFTLPFDVSDAISLSANWAPDPAYAASFGVNGWQQAPGTFIWYLAACLSGVCENNNVVEPIGKWIFTPGVGWSDGAKNIQINESDGSSSDFVGIANDGPNGTATVSFQSIDSAVPEPATGAMMLLGFAGIGVSFRRRRPVTISQAA